MYIKDSGSRDNWPTGAQRDQRNGKGRYDLIPPEAPALLAQVLEEGGQNYGERNWEKGMPLPRCLDSLLRHLNQFQAREWDEDHLAHALANLAFLVAYRARIRAGTLPRSLDEQGYLEPHPPGAGQPDPQPGTAETPAEDYRGILEGQKDYPPFRGGMHVQVAPGRPGGLPAPAPEGPVPPEKAAPYPRWTGSWQAAPPTAPPAQPARKKVVYVSGPYSDPRGAWFVRQNIEAARYVTAALWKVDGVVPLCPHLNSQWMDGLVTRETFLGGDLELVARCDGILMIGEWGQSDGALKEFTEARRLGKRVFFSWPGGLANIREWAVGDA